MFVPERVEDLEDAFLAVVVLVMLAVAAALAFSTGVLTELCVRNSKYSVCKIIERRKERNHSGGHGTQDVLWLPCCIAAGFSPARNYTIINTLPSAHYYMPFPAPFNCPRTLKTHCTPTTRAV